VSYKTNANVQAIPNKREHTIQHKYNPIENLLPREVAIIITEPKILIADGSQSSEVI
jgi:hypothetical protein